MIHRHVHRLRFTCAREDDARHGRVLFEDALRTASLGDESRLVLVRRLDLGRMPPGVSATEWSRRLEQAFRVARPKAVRFDAPPARDAPAVYFPSRHEPWLVLAQRIATHRACDEWFWPSALSGWHPTSDRAATLRHCVRVLSAQGGLPLTLQLAARLNALGALSLLLTALQPADLAGIEPMITLETPAAVAPPDSSPPFAALTSPDAACVASWGLQDIRTRWLAAVYLTRALDPRQLPFVVSLSPACVAALLAASTRDSGNLPAGQMPPPSPRFAMEQSSPVASPPDAGQPDRSFTRAGGLFFVLPLLARAGLPAYLASLPRSEAVALPWQVLRLVLLHARIADDDTLAVMLRDLPPSRTPLGRWLLAANRLALRLARLNLRQLTLRPALVALTPTHVDVFFRPSEADLRIRRAALDVDPGWLPWLGRAVAFHYNRED